MTTSDQINDLAAALAKAQAEMTGAKKDSINPHFRSQYADLASVREACLPALTKHGLAIVQSPRLVSAGEGQWMVEVETRLLHASGQWLSDILAVPVSKIDAQGVGSAVTYARRYALSAFSSVAPADDDGESAVGRAATRAQPTPKAVPDGYHDWWLDLEATAESGFAELESAWKKSPAEYRDHLRAVAPKALDALKTKARAVVTQ